MTENPKLPRVAIIGAGPAGLTAALVLARGGVAADVYEAAPQVGGMCRSFQLWGRTVDVGPHRFFSKERAVNALWLDVVGRDYEMVPRLSRILYRGRLFDYPLDALNVIRNLGPREIARCGFDYLRERVRPRRELSTFEDWVSARFGRRLYEIFFKTYSEKLWGISCRELSRDFAAQRIKQLDLVAVVTAALGLGGGRRHRTLADEFAYPIDGTGAVYEAMARQSVARGARLHLGTRIESVAVQRGRVAGVCPAGGEVRPCDIVISSMPLTLLIRGLEGAPAPVREAARRLEFRNTILCYLEVAGDGHFPDNWVYVHSPSLACGRITNFANWSSREGQRATHTILCLEFWANSSDPWWRADDDEVIARAKRELGETGLVRGATISRGYVLRIPRSYPIYRMGYEGHVAVIQRHLESVGGLHAIGRYGAFKYNNQDHSILMGIRVAEAILSGQRPNLWAINSDDEYQEGAIITSTGLVPLSDRQVGSSIEQARIWISPLKTMSST